MNRKSPFSCCGGHRHAPPPHPNRFARASLDSTRRATSQDHCPTPAPSTAHRPTPGPMLPTTTPISPTRLPQRWTASVPTLPGTALTGPWSCAAFTHAGGPGRILVQLLRCCAIRPLPHAATVRRWLRQAGLAAPTPPDTPTAFPTLRNPIRIWHDGRRRAGAAAEQIAATFAGCVSSMRPAPPPSCSQPGLRPTQLGRRRAPRRCRRRCGGLQPLGAAGGLLRRR